MRYSPSWLLAMGATLLASAPAVAGPQISVAASGSIEDEIGGTLSSATSSYNSLLDTPLGLNSKTVVQSINGSNRGGTTSASATAGADLAPAQLQAVAIATVPTGPFVQSVATSNGILQDTLTFSIKGATATTVTRIDFLGHYDGTFAYLADAGADTFNYLLYVQPVGGPQANFRDHFSASAADPGGLLQETISPNWASTSVVRISSTAADFSGGFDIIGSTATVTFGQSLTLTAGQGMADFSASLGLALPAAATFTSVSSVFLTAVPEPAVWSLFISGVGLMGAAWRRRERPAPRPAARCAR